MKVRITALKSTAWPKDAQVGDVVEVAGDTIPGWALGKCEPVAEGASPAGDEQAKAATSKGKAK